MGGRRRLHQPDDRRDPEGQWNELFPTKDATPGGKFTIWGVTRLRRNGVLRSLSRGGHPRLFLWVEE
jgi:hypothetical protein